MYKIGTAKVDITYFKENAGLLGYIVPHNIAKGVASPIYARSLVLEDTEENIIALVVVELAFCTSKLRQEILKALEEELPTIFTATNVLISAQHTHSTIGGYSQFFMHNILIPGYDAEACQTYTQGIAKSIITAYHHRKTGVLKLGEAFFAPNSEVAFNRSIKSYNQNPECKEKITSREAAHALDLRMQQLEAYGTNQQLVAAFNWFGCHPTSLSNKNTLISSDNKGYAARLLENELNPKQNEKQEEVVTGFLQNAAGDVTPNFIWESKSKVKKRFKNDFEKMEFNGQLQFEKALAILQQASENKSSIKGDIDSAIAYVDMGNVTVDTKYTVDQTGNPRTASPCIGIACLQGTKEGPVMSKPLGAFARFLNLNVRLWDPLFVKAMTKEELKHFYDSQYPKSSTIDAGAGRIMGTQNISRFFMPSFIDPVIRNLKKIHKQGFMQHKPWLPQVVTIQLLKIGQLCLAALPSEITTIAAQRLKSTIIEELRETAIEDVIICSISNNYAGYVTTYEEYQVQAYEGGHTLYGKWTLAAYQTMFAKLCQEFRKPKIQRNRVGCDAIPVLAEALLWKGTMK
ncbi:MAG: neutral/alkaline non-lysosomal ceramidase N-terminal domain-containing protein [Saprospiraceae bacterium]|nr:neutral/alkaline non-lysosomal ceramidase N-terminal domain-containing protein [Saprospiraceae bacterium]